MEDGTMKTLKAKDDIPMITYSSYCTVMSDFDSDVYRNVKALAHRICNRYRLQGYLILLSSKNHFHVVYNRRVSWAINMEILAYTCMQSGNKSLTAWFLQQCHKHYSSLRVNCKGRKHSPRIVYVYGRIDGQVRDYLEFRSLFKDFEPNELSSS
jgi:hypothetical protein